VDGAFTVLGGNADDLRLHEFMGCPLLGSVLVILAQFRRRGMPRASKLARLVKPWARRSSTCSLLLLSSSRNHSPCGLM
jgi:hypothetical protein